MGAVVVVGVRIGGKAGPAEGFGLGANVGMLVGPVADGRLWVRYMTVPNIAAATESDATSSIMIAFLRRGAVTKRLASCLMKPEAESDTFSSSSSASGAQSSILTSFSSTSPSKYDAARLKSLRRPLGASFCRRQQVQDVEPPSSSSLTLPA